MELSSRQLVVLIAEASLEERLGDDAERLGAHGYTVTDVRGKGSHGFRGAGIDVDRNIRMEIVCDRPTAERILAHVREAYSADYALVAYLAPVEVLRPYKF